METPTTQTNDLKTQPALVAARGSAADVTKELNRIRDEVKPTRRGILICSQTMGQMLQSGWHKDQLDALEILFWSVRDADGRVILSASTQIRRDLGV